MGLIIKDKIRQLITGYPTVSDKYNAAGGILESGTAKFGDLVVNGASTGYYKVPTATLTLADIAGFVLGTNVKLNETWPEGNVQVNSNEAFNLTLPGTYIAIELDSTATVSDIAAGKAVAVFLNTALKYGKLTTTGTTDATDLDGVVFTGIYENQGTTAAPKYVAEVLIK